MGKSCWVKPRFKLKLKVKLGGDVGSLGIHSSFMFYLRDSLVYITSVRTVYLTPRKTSSPP